MPGPFDTTTRYLVETYPADWLAYLGLAAPGPIDVVDANLSAVSAEVDKAVRVGAGVDTWLAHLEFQSSYDPTMPRRLHRYNAMLHLQHELPVASVLVLLRPSADGPALSGAYTVALPGASPYLRFAYATRRVWQEPADALLAGPLGTLPLAPLGAVERLALPRILGALDARVTAEASTAEAARLRVVTYTLLGLRYPRAVVDHLMSGLQAMRDSSTYQAILDEGRIEGHAQGRTEGHAQGRLQEARTLLLYLGTRRFGTPGVRVRATIEAATDPDLLDGWCRRVLDATSWDDLLAAP